MHFYIATRYITVDETSWTGGKMLPCVIREAAKNVVVEPLRGGGGLGPKIIQYTVLSLVRALMVGPLKKEIYFLWFHHAMKLVHLDHRAQTN